MGIETLKDVSASKEIAVNVHLLFQNLWVLHTFGLQI